MKRIGVAGIITKHCGDLLLGRRGKDPNRGLYVFPGGGLEEGETLEQAFCREIEEETGYKVLYDKDRWSHVYPIELSDRIVLVAKGEALNQNEDPQVKSDLYDVQWFHRGIIPYDELSPPVKEVLFRLIEEDNEKISYHDPYYRSSSAW